jgi:hypothetical protein
MESKATKGESMVKLQKFYDLYALQIFPKYVVAYITLVVLVNVVQ